MEWVKTTLYTELNEKSQVKNTPCADELENEQIIKTTTLSVDFLCVKNICFGFEKRKKKKMKMSNGQVKMMN